MRHKRSAEDFAAEIKAHLELEAAELKSEGLSEEEARRRARVEFGNADVAQERFRLRDRAAWMDNLMRDVRYGLRGLVHNPGFAVVTVLTLALGIGANTAVFSVMNAVLLRSLPVADPSRLVYLRTSNPPNRTGTIDTNQTFSYPVYDALRKQKRAFSDLIAFVPLSNNKVAVRVGPEPEEAEGDMVSGDFFSGLGVNLVRGRGFSEQDETDRAPVAVISYNYWTRRFARSGEVVGKTLYVNGVPMTIVGVAGQGFEGLEGGGTSTDFWIPLQSRTELNAWGNPPDDGKTYQQDATWWCLRLIGRLAPGVTRVQALGQLQPGFQSAAYIGLGAPESGEKLPVLSVESAKSFPGYESMYGKPLKVLMAMVGLVLLIALSNVVMLLLARNATRQREFSLRLALGGGRRVLFRQLAAEGALLVAAGGLVAWFFAVEATRALAAWAQIESSLAPDRTVLLFTLAILVLAALLATVAPLRIVLSVGPLLALKTSAATSHTDAGRTKTGRAIVVLQMALCLVLLVGAGLLVKTMENLKNTPLGFSTDGLVVFGVNPNVKSVPEGVAFYRNLMERLRRLPGVESVTIMDERLGSGWSNNSAMKVDGKLPDVGGGPLTVRSNVAGPEFFRTLGIPVLEGRDFADTDTATSPRVGIVNEEFVKRFLPNQNPLGYTFGPTSMDIRITIIGVVRDHKFRSIVEEPIPMAWFMYAQIPVMGPKQVELRVNGDALAILPSAQKALQEIDPNLPLIQPMTQRAQYDEGIAQQLMFGRLAEFFGLLAVVLVATGLYGMLAYRVNTRTAEIGVRMAMGAQRGQVVWMILRDSLLLTMLGVAAGIPLALFVGRALGSSLYGVKALDPFTYVFAVVGVTLVALGASVVPARRAASVDPLKALRSE